MSSRTPFCWTVSPTARAPASYSTRVPLANTEETSFRWEWSERLNSDTTLFFCSFPVVHIRRFRKGGKTMFLGSARKRVQWGWTLKVYPQRDLRVDSPLQLTPEGRKQRTSLQEMLSKLTLKILPRTHLPHLRPSADFSLEKLRKKLMLHLPRRVGQSNNFNPLWTLLPPALSRKVVVQHLPSLQILPAASSSHLLRAMQPVRGALGVSAMWA